MLNKGFFAKEFHVKDNSDTSLFNDSITGKLSKNVKKVSDDFQLPFQNSGFMINHNISDYNLNYSMHTRWKDMDSFQHINNAAFLTYIEDARISMFNRWNINDVKKSIIVASLKINYHIQLKHPCRIIIGQQISRIGNTSFDISFGIFIDGNNSPISTGMVTCVCFDYNKNLPVPVFSEIKKDYKN